MKKLLIGAGLVIGGGLLARRCASSCGSFDFEKMIERMPENAPPQVDVSQHQRDPREYGPDPRAARE